MSYSKEQQAAWRPETQMVRGGTRRSQFGETCEAIYLTSGFVYENAEEAEAAFKGEITRFQYSRFANPTVEMFQDRMCLMEGAPACRATATGMAAVFAALACFVNAGERVVGASALFGSCLFILTEILPRYGIDVEIVDGTDLDQWKDALKRPAKAVFFESPSNPGLDMIDIEAVSGLAHAAGAKVVIDNVFATPVLQKPREFGADIVVYSATKHIDGQGRCLGGAVLAEEDYINTHLQPFYRHTGPAMSPFNAWVLLKGLETLEMRVAQHCRNAADVAQFLDRRNDIAEVRFPGLKSHPQYALAQKQMRGTSNIVSFTVDGDKAHTFRFLNNLKLIDISNNLGDSKSLVTHPATTTHQRLPPDERAKLGITDGMVRLSVGLEHPDDVKEDIAQALAAA